MSKEKHRPKIYVAGPYSSSPQANTDNAVDVGDLIVDIGGDPFIPHLSHYRDQRHLRPYQFYITEDLRWLEVCDALYRLEGKSAGADAEEAEAKRLGIPVFHSLAALGGWILLWQGPSRCEHLERMVEVVTDYLALTDCVDPEIRRRPDCAKWDSAETAGGAHSVCRKCWRDYLDQRASEGGEEK